MHDKIIIPLLCLDSFGGMATKSCGQCATFKKLIKYRNDMCNTAKAKFIVLNLTEAWEEDILIISVRI